LVVLELFNIITQNLKEASDYSFFFLQIGMKKENGFPVVPRCCAAIEHGGATAPPYIFTSP
jgi:hypothetical protein